MRWFSFIVTPRWFGMSVVSAQTVDIRGIVSDSASGEKIPYATVQLERANRGAVTNNNGFGIFGDVSSERQRFSVLIN